MMMEKTLNDWLDYANQLHPKIIDLGLKRLMPVAQKLNLLPANYKTITVAGTNGKGSTVSLLESIYLAADYKVCTITSPELLIFNERLRINGNNVSDDAFCEACEAVDIARGNITLTFFEFTILASLIIIQRESPDIAILEIGLGGRHDAVNIIDPDVAIITTIDLDHTDILGSTRDEIGKQKAGILRKKIPFIYGEPNPPQSIIDEALQLETQNFHYGKDFGFKENTIDWQWFSNNKTYNHLPLPKIHLQNASTALMAIESFQTTLHVNKNAIIQALKNVFIPGRFQIIEKEFTHIFDVAHNPASARLLAENLHKHACTGKTFAIFSILNNKDLENTITPLRDLIDEWHIAGMEHLPRGLAISALKPLIEKFNLSSCQYYSTLKEAYEAIKSQASKNDRTVTYGSFHTVSGVMKLL